MRRGQRTAHRWMSYAMTIAVATALILAWALSQSRGDLPAPERLSPPASGSGEAS